MQLLREGDTLKVARLDRLSQIRIRLDGHVCPSGVTGPTSQASCASREARRAAGPHGYELRQATTDAELKQPGAEDLYFRTSYPQVSSAAWWNVRSAAHSGQAVSKSPGP
ncbi:hypothetical protein GCM10011579_070050 [Streptomyces albiflavescens]|uniref:Uncharacterized protein n=1 Tax=Streptomyces albiflavescens TaxID=1623582 RepID=A0A918D8P9_9ACTN|nr:hypothetical protein GCM10011579_070050 [Streptomyces albiflavescens]